MEVLKELFELNFSSLLIAFIVIIAATKVVFESVEWLFKKLGLESRWLNKEKDNHKLLLNTVDELKKFQETNEKNIKKLIDHDIGIDSTLAKLTLSIDDIIHKLTILQEHSNANEFASREALADRINQKYKYYIDIQGIPEDEYDEFIALHKAYQGVGGNHTGDAKFNYCMENLKIIPSNVKLNISSNNKKKTDNIR